MADTRETSKRWSTVFSIDFPSNGLLIPSSFMELPQLHVVVRFLVGFDLEVGEVTRLSEDT